MNKYIQVPTCICTDVHECVGKAAERFRHDLQSSECCFNRLSFTWERDNSNMQLAASLHIRGTAAMLMCFAYEPRDCARHHDINGLKVLHTKMVETQAQR